MAQYEINSSVWIDEYTVQHHINQYLSNLLLSYDYYHQWNSEMHQFESALPDRLTYTPFASMSIQVDAKELDYHQRSILLKWENFDVGRIDSVIKDSKGMYTTLLSYDSLGRLTNSSYHNTEYLPAGERIEYTIAYNSESSQGFRVEITWATGILYTKKSTSVLHYSFSEDQKLIWVSGSHQSARENTSFENSYTYDSIGRLTQATRIPVSDVYRDRDYSYSVSAFHLDSAQNNYNLLKIPSIQHWLKSYPDSGLTIIAYQKFEPNRNQFVEYSYLVDSHQNRLLMLRPYPHYFGVNSDSNSVTKSYCSISTSQNLNDTIPYDPNYQPRYIGTFYSECSVEERYTTPPGLVNAGSVYGYKRSEHPLSNGWKRISYQRGSSSPSRFAPGYPVSVRYDILYGKHLILDPNGIVRYIMEYDKLIRLNVLQDSSK
jgi:hypothetical protein